MLCADIDADTKALMWISSALDTFLSTRAPPDARITDVFKMFGWLQIVIHCTVCYRYDCRSRNGYGSSRRNGDSTGIKLYLVARF